MDHNRLREPALFYIIYLAPYFGPGDDMGTLLQEFIEDQQIIDGICHPRTRIIMVIGGIDTGKTTLVEGIAGHLSRSTALGICDLDVGQSHIGPPTTISWCRAGEPFTGWEGVYPEGFYFTGTLSPEGNLLPCITGAKIVNDRALSACEKVIIDTTGFITGPVAGVLKQYKFDILSPHMILCLEREEELSHILGSYPQACLPAFHRIPVPSFIKEKSPQVRSHYRQERFAAYFSEARTAEFSLTRFRVRFTKHPAPDGPFALRHRVVSFRDRANRDVALGVIQGIDRKGETISVKTPLGDFTEIGTLLVGNTTVLI